MPTAPHNESTVLVVDDEPLLRMNATDILEEAGFAPVDACNAQEALAQIVCHPEISALFTDINMPGDFDGLELARRVHERRPDIQIILTSGRHPPTKGDIPGSGRFLPKPYDGAVLITLLLARRGERRNTR
jgi:CheY-like chemotaxis protein